MNDLGTEKCSVATIFKHKSITWEKLAEALERMQEYQSAAVKIKAYCTGNSTVSVSACVLTV